MPAIAGSTFELAGALRAPKCPPRTEPRRAQQTGATPLSLRLKQRDPAPRKGWERRTFSSRSDLDWILDWEPGKPLSRPYTLRATFRDLGRNFP